MHCVLYSSPPLFLILDWTELHVKSASTHIGVKVFLKSFLNVYKFHISPYKAIKNDQTSKFFWHEGAYLIFVSSPSVK